MNVNKNYDFIVNLKYDFLTRATNPLLKVLFYLWVIVDATLYHNFPLGFFSLIFFLFLIGLIDAILEIIVNPTLNKPQKKFLSIVYFIFTIPTIFLLNGSLFFIIFSIFGLVSGLIQLLKNNFNDSRSVIFFTFSIFIVYSLFFLGSNVNSVLWGLLVLIFLTFYPLRLVQNISELNVEFNDSIQKFMEKNRKWKGDMKKYSIKFKDDKIKIVYYKEKLFFRDHSQFYDIFKERVNSNKVRKELNYILKSRDILHDLKLKFNRDSSGKSNLFFYKIYTLLFSVICSYEHLIYLTKFTIENYKKLNIPKSKYDQKLWLSDREIQIISEELKNILLPIMYLITFYEKMPSDEGLILIKKTQKESLLRFKNAKINKRVKDRLQIAQLEYENNEKKLESYIFLQKYCRLVHNFIIDIGLV